MNGLLRYYQNAAPIADIDIETPFFAALIFLIQVIISFLNWNSETIHLLRHTMILSRTFSHASWKRKYKPLRESMTFCAWGLSLEKAAVFVAEKNLTLGPTPQEDGNKSTHCYEYFT